MIEGTRCGLKVIGSWGRSDQAFIQLSRSDTGIWRCLESDAMSRGRVFGRISAVIKLESTRQNRCDQTQLGNKTADA